MNGDDQQARPTVLHYIGYSKDGGGTLAVIRAVSGTTRFRSVLGVGPAFETMLRGDLRVWRGPTVAGEKISVSNAVRCFGVAWRVRHWLRRRPHRIFHGHSRAGLLVALWLRLLGESRVAVSVHCLGRQRWFYRVAARILGARLRWLGPTMKRHYGYTDASWAGCIPDCTQVPHAIEPRPGGGSRQAPIRLGCVGGLVAVKQWEIALHALAQSADALTLWHAGAEDGSAESAAYSAWLRQLVRELNLEPRVRWGGALSDLASFYANLDVLVVASRWEASSVAALEAAAAGVPVVAPADSGTRDLIEAAEAGWLFRSDDAADLARVLDSLVASGALRQFRAQPEKLQRFSAPVVTAQWADFYRALLDAG